jgi:hypothetical protein
LKRLWGSYRRFQREIDRSSDRNDVLRFSLLAYVRQHVTAAAWKAMRLPCPPIPLHPGKIQEIKKKYYRRLIHLRIAVVTTS